MAREIGARERQLREQTEARYLANLAPIKKSLRAKLVKAIDEASKKRGKLVKRKRK